MIAFRHLALRFRRLQSSSVHLARLNFLSPSFLSPQSLEDLVAHYDNTVRTCKGEVVQFVYGSDNFDPCDMETSTSPINFERLLLNVQVRSELAREQRTSCLTYCRVSR